MDPFLWGGDAAHNAVIETKVVPDEGTDRLSFRPKRTIKLVPRLKILYLLDYVGILIDGPFVIYSAVVLNLNCGGHDQLENARASCRVRRKSEEIYRQLLPSVSYMNGDYITRE